MKFLKYYLPLMLKLFGTQIIISLLSNMLFGTLSDLPILLSIGTVCALFVYFYLQYRTVWEHTCNETMKPAEEQHHRGAISGLYIGLCNGLPAFIFNLIPVLFPMHVTENGDLSGGIGKLCYTLAKFFFNGQYVAILHGFFPTKVLTVSDPVLAAENAHSILASIPWYLPTFLPLALVTWFAFWLGLKDRSLSQALGIETKPKKKKERKDPPKLK